MVADFAGMDLFCRINVQAEMPFQEFAKLIARCVGGSNVMNAVTGKEFDLSVFENDDFDSKLVNTGNDRWLHFRYTLEIDPIEGVSPSDYVAAIGKLLESLWSSGRDAVASCDFEDRLPRNERRLKWEWLPGDHGTTPGQMPMIVGSDIPIPQTADVERSS